MIHSARARIAAAAIAGALVAGCASQSVSTMPQAGTPTVIVQPQTGPPACSGQKVTKKYSSVTERLLGKAASLCIPTFQGLGGALGYPAAKPVEKVTVTSTTIDNGFPYPGSGTPVFYLEVALPGATSFGTTLRAATGLTGKKIKAKTAYTVFLSYLKYGFWYGGPSCYTTATAGKYGGAVQKLGSVLKGQSFGGAYTLLFEVYPGQQSGTSC
jgi:hypothetical protein